MSRFYVGQRVRIVRCAFPKFIGRECVLTGFSPNVRDSSGQTAGGWETDLTHPGLCGGPLAFAEYEIEPLSKPKQQETITWDEACFDRDGRYRQPVYMEARV